MIVHIGREFLNLNDAQKEENVVEIVAILDHGHFLKMDADIKEAVINIVDTKLANCQKSLFYEASEEYLSPSKNMQRWLRTLEFYNFTKDQRKVLLLKPSELLVENAPNEWPVYKKICQAYSVDNDYSSIFQYVERALSASEGINGEQAGGKTEIPAMIDYKEKNEFHDLYKYKVCVLFDRDTDDDNSFAPDNMKLFKKLAGKSHEEIANEDIYKLNFGEDYVWHSWYKRAIENYFPKEEYERLALDMSDYPNDANKYDYIKFPIESTKEWKDKHKTKKDKEKAKYEKVMMKEIGKDMKRSDYERNLKSFDVDGLNLSEFQLFLLKLAKIA